MNYLLLLGVSALGYWVFKILNKPREPQENRSNPVMDGLREKGIKVKVEFDQCEIRDYSYYQEIEKEHLPGIFATNALRFDISAMNVLSGDQMSNVTNIATNRVILIFHYIDPSNGEKIDFSSGLLPMDKDSLQMNFIANDIFLFFDPMDPENYFFEFSPRGN